MVLALTNTNPILRHEKDECKPAGRTSITLSFLQATKINCRSGASTFPGTKTAQKLEGPVSEQREIDAYNWRDGPDKNPRVDS